MKPEIYEEGFELVAETLSFKVENERKSGMSYRIGVEENMEHREEREITHKVSKREKTHEAEKAVLRSKAAEMEDTLKKYEKKIEVLYEYNDALEALMREIKENFVKELNLHETQHRIVKNSLEERVKCILEDNGKLMRELKIKAEEHGVTEKELQQKVDALVKENLKLVLNSKMKEVKKFEMEKTLIEEIENISLEKDNVVKSTNELKEENKALNVRNDTFYHIFVFLFWFSFFSVAWK